MLAQHLGQGGQFLAAVDGARGLPGVFSTSQRVRGVMAACSAAGVSLKPCSMPQSTMTGVPSFTRTMSGNEGQYGAGTMTSSPASSVAASAL